MSIIIDKLLKVWIYDFFLFATRTVEVLNGNPVFVYSVLT